MIADVVGVGKIMVSIVVRVVLLVPAALTAFVVWDKQILNEILKWSWK